jgi:hypothetical protein
VKRAESEEAELKKSVSTWCSLLLARAELARLLEKRADELGDWAGELGERAGDLGQQRGLGWLLLLVLELVLEMLDLLALGLELSAARVEMFLDGIYELLLALRRSLLGAFLVVGDGCVECTQLLFLLEEERGSLHASRGVWVSEDDRGDGGGGDVGDALVVDWRGIIAEMAAVLVVRGGLGHVGSLGRSWTRREEEE